jgi:Tfp pilus assembly protein PilX
MKNHLSLPPTAQSGVTLVICSLLMLGVALLTSASLRSLHEGISLAHGNADRRLAQMAADAALHDAVTTLSMIPDQLSLAQAQGAHALGEFTGASFSHGERMRSGESPRYLLELLPRSEDTPPAVLAATPAPDIYRVTAWGTGRHTATTVVLQADFERQACHTAAIAMPAEVLAEALESAAPDEAAVCVPRMRQLAWRILPTI